VLLGVVEFGLAFFDYLTTSNMSRIGARTASTLGNSSTADYQILQKIAQSTNSMPTSEIQSIVVYKAASSGAAPTSSCLSGSVSGTCNFYTASNLATASNQFACGTSSPDRYWCPTTRLVGASATGSPATGPPDYIGVYIKVIHPNVTGLFGSNYTFTEYTVIRIEAQTP
jgi:Flp pilus assembly protein TadG